MVRNPRVLVSELSLLCVGENDRKHISSFNTFLTILLVSQRTYN